MMIHLFIEGFFWQFHRISHWESHQVIIIYRIWAQLRSFMINFVKSLLMSLLLLCNHYFSTKIFGKSTFFHFSYFLILSKKSHKKIKKRKNMSKIKVEKTKRYQIVSHWNINVYASWRSNDIFLFKLNLNFF